MKRLFIIAIFAGAFSLAASFGTAQLEIRSRPTYDQNRDQQWLYMQQNQQREQRQRDEWQRDQWQRDQQQRKQRHQDWQDYDWWLQHHRQDYDNRAGHGSY